MQKQYTQHLPVSPITKQFISQFLPKNPVIIEAGAHIGRDTVKMAKLWPDAKIYAFEPVPDLFARLKKSTENYPHIYCYQLALSDKNGLEILFVSSGASTAASSLLKPKEYLTMRPEVIFAPLEVSTVRLDDWAKLYITSPVDFMWLDMQGAELLALKAAGNILAEVKAVLIEISLVERFENNPTISEVITFMADYNFKPILQDQPKHNKVNLLFVK